MGNNISLATAIVAIIISIIAVASSFVIMLNYNIDTVTIDRSRLADNTVTGTKIMDGPVADNNLNVMGAVITYTINDVL
jgi:hypothetical protein